MNSFVGSMKLEHYLAKNYGLDGEDIGMLGKPIFPDYNPKQFQ